MRALIFKHLIQLDKESRHDHMHSMYNNETVDIRREYILEDAFDKLYPLGEEIKKLVRIQFIDSNLNAEHGIDGGGLFKEFITKITEQVFEP